MGLEHPLDARQLLVHAVAELVGQRHHIARPPLVVQQHVRMHRRHRARAEGAAPLARLDRGIDPAPLEEPPGDLGQARVEAGVGAQHRVTRLGPRIVPIGRGEGRVAIVIEQRIQPQQPSLQPVVARHDVVAGGHGLDQSLHGAVVHFVAEVARADPRGIVTQPVIRRLVGQDGVEDVGVGAQQDP